MLADWTEFEGWMNTLLRAGTIRSIKEVWWDARPHPDSGVTENRILNGVPGCGRSQSVCGAPGNWMSSAGRWSGAARMSGRRPGPQLAGG